MDAIDLRILEILQRDARVTQQEIARRVRLSQPSVADRIRKLESRGVMYGYEGSKPRQVLVTQADLARLTGASEEPVEPEPSGALPE